MPTLRDYQRECLMAMRDAASKGVTRQLIIKPTGCGKSVTFSNIPSFVPYDGQLWLVVHRNELVEQAAGHLARNNPGLKVGIERAERVADLDCDIVVGSIQSLGQDSSEYKARLRRYPIERVGCLVIDEVHHAANSKIYLNVIRYLRLFKGDPENDPSRLLIGYTATAGMRSDGVGLEALFDEIVYSREIREMIELGWLCPIQAFRVETEIDLSGVKVAHGDFATKELESKVNTPERNSLVVSKYQELGQDGSGIAFTVDVRHSHDLAAEFRRQGISALPMSGDTPEEERGRIFASHQSGETKIISACNVVNEGCDLPWAKVGILARPTKSQLLLTQQVGRLLRPYPSPEEVQAGASRVKDKAILIDLVDNSVRHRLCAVPTLFGLPPEFQFQGENLIEVLEEIEKTQEEHKQIRMGMFHDLRSLRSVVESIDLLTPPSIPDEVRALSELSWFEGPGPSYQIIGPQSHFSIRFNTLGQFEIARHESGLRRSLKSAPSLDTAVLFAEGLLTPQDKMVLRSGARWRRDKPTEKQARLLSRLDRKMYSRFGGSIAEFLKFLTEGYSKGDVSRMIAERMSRASTKPGVRRFTKH